MPEIDPTKFDPCRWESESGAMTSGEGRRTSIGQMTDAGRSMHVRGKKPIVAAYEKTRLFDLESAARVREENPYTLNDGPAEEEGRNVKGEGAEEDIGVSSDFCLVRHRARRDGMSQSFLFGIGAEVASLVGPTSYVSSAPYATAGGGPTDPFELDGERRKDLLFENYASAVPGYTGKRRIF